MQKNIKYFSHADTGLGKEAWGQKMVKYALL